MILGLLLTLGIFVVLFSLWCCLVLVGEADDRLGYPRS